MDIESLRVDGLRLQHSMEEMAKIGAIAGDGVQRLSLSNKDKEARDLFIRWLKALELDITIDERGNIFGKRLGRNLCKMFLEPLKIWGIQVIIWSAVRCMMPAT